MQKQETTQTIVRWEWHIPKPFKEVMARLESSIAATSNPPSLWTPDTTSSKENYEAATNASLGPHGFMQFLQLKHGSWMPLYGVHAGKGSTRVIFGNPQVAITMLRHDVYAGLFVPVEALVLEREDGQGTDVVQIKPSSLIAREEKGVELKEAAEALDRKVETLWEWVSGES